MYKLKFGFIATILILFFNSCQKQSSLLTEEQKLANFFDKDSVKILVTDSGLGGLSVAADVVERLKPSKVFSKADVIFFNAQPHLKSGYNSMKTTDQKVTVFNNALNAIEKNFDPDLILIACNTLSVLYEYTAYSEVADIPVIGIVETGIDLINSKLKENENSKVILFATKTTVSQGKHKTGLTNLGIQEENIITQPCQNLAGRIERDSQSDTTRTLVNKYVDETLSQITEGEDIFVSYNCTHYGYVDNLFQEAFNSSGIKVKEFLNPNPFMADFIFEDKYLNRHNETTVNVEIVSQPELPPGRQASIYNLIEPQSSQTAEALFDYRFEPDYFEWESIVNEGQPAKSE